VNLSLHDRQLVAQEQNLSGLPGFITMRQTQPCEQFGDKQVNESETHDPTSSRGPCWPACSLRHRRADEVFGTHKSAVVSIRAYADRHAASDLLHLDPPGWDGAALHTLAGEQVCQVILGHEVHVAASSLSAEVDLGERIRSTHPVVLELVESVAS
jgi:hypothetical protein